ncbi:MAG TPA: hypothetical protein VMG82_19605 [Candidatus Sulfotelmatobacter sp.]|nr:hypothetical protein [Candidatus Sulfotelmatobacter sp.]
MKPQAWGWLTAAVLAAGLNSSYHNGGLQWAHEIADRVQHNSSAVLALATGRADWFLAEARRLKVEPASDDAPGTEAPRCPYAAATAMVQSSFDESQSEFDNLQALSAREQAQLARLEANRARIEAQVHAKLARIHLADDSFRFADGDFSFTDKSFTPVVIQVPRIRCQRLPIATPHIPRVHVRIPRIQVPDQVVEVDSSDAGPI